MGGCSALNCNNRSPKHVMLRFPKDPVLCQKWLDACGRNDLPVTTNGRLCEAHFEKEQWKKFRCTLLPGQVPKVFPCCTKTHLARPEPLLQHTYAPIARHSDSCPKKLLPLSVPELPPVLHESCKLESEIEELQALLNKTKEEGLEELRKLRDQMTQSEAATLLAQDLIMKNYNEERKQYTMEDYKRGLRLRFAAGSSGYNTIRKEVPEAKVPCIRGLQKVTEHISFEPGLQDDMFNAISEKLKCFDDVRDRDCVAFVDEMSSKCQVDYDLGTGKLIGHVTLPGGEQEVSCKTEAYMFGGLKTRWKQTVGYHFTSSKGFAKQKKDVIFEMLRKGHAAGLNVVALACDMGNRSMLSEMGFATQKDCIKYSIPHPADNSKKLFCVPDCVHLFKSLKESIVNNQTLILSDEIMEQFNLPTNEVKLQHIKFLEAYQRREDLKFVPNLTFKDIATGHFSKMNFQSAYHMISHPVAASLKYLVKKKVVNRDFETTSWFIKIMNRWREIVTSRCRLHSLGKKNLVEYAKKIDLLKLVVKIFKSMRFEDGWKPIQTHIIMATEALLEIQEHLLAERGYEFVLLSRFSQDIIENLFSVVRLQRPVPTPVEVKYRLKAVTLSQFMQRVKKSQYEYAEADDFIDVLLSKENAKEQIPVCDLTKFVWHSEVPSRFFQPCQEDILYRVCGYPIVTLIKNNRITCQECVLHLQSPGKNHENRDLLAHFNYTEGAQFEVCDGLFKMFRLIECNLRIWKQHFTSGESYDILILHIISNLSHFKFYTCHDIKDMLISHFVKMRLKQYTKRLQQINPPALTSQFSSKSCGAKFLADNFKGTGGKSKRANGSGNVKTVTGSVKTTTVSGPIRAQAVSLLRH